MGRTASELLAQLDGCGDEIAECFQKDDADGHLMLLGLRSGQVDDSECSEAGKPYRLMPLPYGYAALEPHIDNETMHLHHDKHLAAYVLKVNMAFQKQKQPLPCLLQLQKDAINMGKVFRNNGGGVFNHNLFFSEMAQDGTSGQASEKLAGAIRRKFGSFSAFKRAFEDVGSRVFGSGWAWLVVDSQGQLAITATSNQDNPLMDGVVTETRGIPILGVDVWEHAYYLKYKNKRTDYIKAWWNVVNWAKVSSWYESALDGKAPSAF